MTAVIPLLLFSAVFVIGAIVRLWRSSVAFERRRLECLEDIDKYFESYQPDIGKVLNSE